MSFQEAVNFLNLNDHQPDGPPKEWVFLISGRKMFQSLGFWKISLMVVKNTAYFTTCLNKIRIIFRRGFGAGAPRGGDSNRPVLSGRVDRIFGHSVEGA